MGFDLKNPCESNLLNIFRSHRQVRRISNRGSSVMRKLHGQAVVLSFAGALLCLAQASGQAAGNWSTARGDAGHSGWQKVETKLSKDTVAVQFKFLWKIKLGKEIKETTSVSEPLLALRLINSRGFKDLVLWAGTDTVYAVDSELGTMVWEKHFDVKPSSPSCGASNLGIVIEAPRVINFNARPKPGTPRPATLPPTPASSRRLGAAAGGGGFGLKGIYVLTGDGYLHEQVLTTGAEFGPPVKFLPGSSGSSNGLSISGSNIYTATKRGCGEAQNAIWSIDVASKDYPVASYQMKTVDPLVSMGPTLGTGVAYLVTGSGASDSTAGVYANSVIALSGQEANQELKVKDWYTPSGSGDNKLQNATPVAFTYKQKQLIAAPGKDGSFVLLDSKSLGGADHHTPLAQTAGIFKAKSDAWSGIATWQDASGTTWMLASAPGLLDTSAKFDTTNGTAPHGSIVAFKIEEKDGQTVLTPSWTSRDLINPAPPVVANGVVIALSQGDAKTHARLYVLDATTGKELYSSGDEITTYAHLTGVSVGDGHAFFTTHDNTLYSFGIGMEH
jgi:outer membrane protein assembly factor BamB